eukprot:COSAG04_NODE_948_length_9222_cov_3.318097_3_plen_97_part_00
MLAAPTAMLKDCRNECDGEPDLWRIPPEYLTDAGIYSNAHVLKCYELGSPADAALDEDSEQTNTVISKWHERRQRRARQSSHDLGSELLAPEPEPQ